MFFKKKKPFVRFVNLIPGVEIAHPVIKSNEHMFDWIRTAALEYKEKLNNSDFTKQIGSTSRCPGIHGIFKSGFIVTAPIDFTITTDETSPGNFEWSCPTRPTVDGQDYISGHSPSQLSAYLPFREDTLASVVKVNTFWKVTSSADIVMIQIPIPYPDHNLFTAATGVVDCCENYHEVNVQIFWHKLNGTHHVKAGTPLCQLIPVPRDFIVDLRVERMTSEDRYIAEAYEYLVRKEYVKNLKSFFANFKKLVS
jgi:hypothetical protein